jgi:hypothetical protein
VRTCVLQLTAPRLMSSQKTPLVTTRGIWYQEDVSGPGRTAWPLLQANTYYWLVVAPSTTLALPNGQFNGAVWAGMDPTVHPLPPAYSGDAHVFTARQLTSECRSGDVANGAQSASAAAFIRSARDWSTVACASARFTNWKVNPGRGAGTTPVRYGVQVVGWQVGPPP